MDQYLVIFFCCRKWYIWRKYYLQNTKHLLKKCFKVFWKEKTLQHFNSSVKIKIFQHQKQLLNSNSNKKSDRFKLLKAEPMRKLSSLSNFLSLSVISSETPKTQNYIQKIFAASSSKTICCISCVWELQFPFFIFFRSPASRVVPFCWILNKAHKWCWMQSKKLQF